MFFDRKPVSHGLHGSQRTANTLSTEAPTDFGGNLHKAATLCGKLGPDGMFSGFEREIEGEWVVLIIY
jgi:hypothetical protein